MNIATAAHFEAGRDRLASIAYRLLGSAHDAEDVVQEAFLRWHAADREYVEVPEAWLTKIVTNLALDRLRSAAARRERASGAWLPEPLLDADPMLGPAETLVQRESVTLAMLTVLEQLTPIERAVYVLREAFSYSHAEIAAMLALTEAGSQQHLHRARRRLAPVRTEAIADQAAARRIVAAFLAAASSGRTERLIALLTDDATGVSDGVGGLAEKLIHYASPARIATAIRAGLTPSPAKHRLAGGTLSIHAAVVNGCPAVLFVLEDRVLGIAVLTVRDNRIAGFHAIAAPHRLRRLAAAWRRREHDAPLIESW
ncbi:sigma-70 family RNA polymerase sigma factor [Nocardia sp. NPDC048505]|uniref:sigma-70 family RNA polymerase sigma factor n=1 Tax=unclassified Nocardia TaxID=2637762 RepID=UPI0033DB6A91